MTLILTSERFSFEEFFLILPKKPILNVEDLKRKYFHELLFAEDSERIELLKRSSMPLIIIISALIAASLTMRLKDSGRFYIFLSGMIIFMSYYGLTLSQEVFGNFFLNSTISFNLPCSPLIPKTPSDMTKIPPLVSSAILVALFRFFSRLSISLC